MSKDLIKNETEIPAKFKPRARLLTQLGDQLIKNESIALVELVKNSYDADANTVTIKIEKPDDPDNAIISIQDDGYGMNADTVENAWLEPGSDFKSQKIKVLDTSPKYHRLPIGEKGIGRFGVHKLGNVIEMTTKTQTGKEVFVNIDWTDLNNYKYLEQFPIKIVERDTPLTFKDGKTGTEIVIKKLRKNWERGIARDVKRSITALTSPFEEIDSFKPKFDIPDKPGWFDGLLRWEDIKDFALFKFDVTMTGDAIVEFNYEFMPWSTMNKLTSREETIENKYIQTFKKLKKADERNAILSLSDFKIGSIRFEGYIFDLDSFILKLGLTDKKGFKEYLKINGGVKVFRDGLRVYDYGEPENDWLGLDFRRFQQPTKAISNNLILGAIYLHRKDSEGLEEKTNREGFVENDSYKAFKSAILHTLELIETLRFEDKKKMKDIYGPTAKSEPVMHILGDAQRYVQEKVKDTEVKTQILKYLHKIEIDYKNVSETLLKAAGAGLSMSVVVHEVEKIISELQKVIKAEKASDRVLKLTQHLSSLIDGYAEIIRKSSKTTENIIQVIDQALFNTEYRLSSHEVSVVKQYKTYKGQTKAGMAKNLLIGSMMNIFDNSIFWLEQKKIQENEKKETFSSKIFINLSEDEHFIYLLIADNGTGFLIPTDGIVEPFVSTKPGGIGLGLHITNEILEGQEGKLLFPEPGDFDIPEEFVNGAVVAFGLKK